MNSLQLKLLFPETKDVQRIRVTGRQVDFLIGMEHASWQPTRMIRAQYSGDFWTWRNRFGECLGGRHPWIKRYEKKIEKTQVSTLYSEIETLDWTEQRPGPYPEEGDYDFQGVQVMKSVVPVEELWE